MAPKCTKGNPRLIIFGKFLIILSHRSIPTGNDMFFRSFEELSIDDSWLSWPGRKLTVSPCTSWQRGPMPFGTAVYPTRLPELPFLTNVRKNIRIKRRKTLSLFGETPTKMWWCLPSACTSSELQQMAPLWLLTSQHCHKNFDCLYHRCLHFQSFLPPKENILLATSHPVFCHFITKELSSLPAGTSSPPTQRRINRGGSG